MGIPVQITHQANLIGRLSVRLQVVLSTAIVLGLAAGSTVPMMFLLTPAFAGTVLVAALRRQSRGFLAGAQANPLPPQTESHVRTTLSGMADGAARRLLADFVRMARAVRADGGATDQGAASDDELDRLVRTAARLARDIEGLDASLAVVERQGGLGPAAGSDQWMETHASVSQTRDRLVQRLLDALAALARARAAGLEAGLGERTDLAELARNLEREAALQADARREVAELLA